MPTLKITHNSGLFSCATIALVEIMKYFNVNKCLPELVDRSEQFVFYKADPSENIIPKLFHEEYTYSIEHEREMVITNEPGEVSFGDYSKFHFGDTGPFVARYFTPSREVLDIMQMYMNKYALRTENTCAVFYRGNDKKRECEVTPYSEFIEKAKELLQAQPDIKFLVQPDETEFLEAFKETFPGRCVWFSETPHMRKKDSAIFYELPAAQKTPHAQYFLAAVIVMSLCKHVITHSGNGSMWLALYRGNMTNVHQFMNKHIY